MSDSYSSGEESESNAKNYVILKKEYEQLKSKLNKLENKQKTQHKAPQKITGTVKHITQNHRTSKSVFRLEESTEIIQIKDAKRGVSKKASQNCKVTKHKQKERVILEI